MLILLQEDEMTKNFLLSAFIIIINTSLWSNAQVDEAVLDSTKLNLYSEVLTSDSIKYEFVCDVAQHATNADTIIYYSSLALSLAESSGFDFARPLVLKGKGYLKKGNSVLALECFTKAADYYSSPQNNSGLATVYLYIAMTYFIQENYDNFKIYIKRAINLYELEEDSIRLASAMHNLGQGYYEIHQYDSALLLYDQTKVIYQNLNDKRGEAYCIGNSGLVYSKLDQLDRAAVNLLKAIKILENYGDEWAIGDFTKEYAFVLQREGKTKEAIEYSHISLGLAYKNNITELKRDASYRLAKIYEQNKQYDSALYYQIKYYTFSESIRNLETVQKTADLRTEFEVQRKQAEVDFLEKNRILQRTIIAGLILIVVLAIGLILLIFLSLRRNKRLTKALEERKVQLEIQSKELQELNHIKDRFFSIISHDLRSPIASLGGISYLIKESQETDNRAILNQATEYIDQSVVTLTGLLENLLNWALSQQGKFPFKEERIDLKELIEEVVRIFASVALSKNQSIDLDLTAGLVVSADKNTMMTVIRNLLSNATKFTDKGGIIQISSHKNNGNAEIIVSDEGIGIPEDKLENIFKLKEDKSSRGTDNEKGLGLGLSLVHEFVTTNKGAIRVESKVGVGTSFYVTFPLL